jgi:hypothetical protein
MASRTDSDYDMKQHDDNDLMMESRNSSRWMDENEGGGFHSVAER